MRVLNAMGLKYAVDQELMQAHDQTCGAFYLGF
jgi:hypothetical protein